MRISGKEFIWKPLFWVKLRNGEMGTIVFKMFQTHLEVEIMVSGFGGTGKCDCGTGKGG